MATTCVRRLVAYLAIVLLVLAYGTGAQAFSGNRAAAAPWPGTVHGCVTNLETSKPIVGVSVELFDGSGRSVAGPGKTDEMGAFSLSAPQPGEYSLAAAHGDFEPLVVAVIVGLKPLPAMMLKLNEHHLIDVPPEPPTSPAEEGPSILAALLGTLVPALAIGILLIVAAARARDTQNQD